MAARSTRRVMYLGILILVVYVLSSGLWPTDETQIKKAIERTRRAAEQEDLDGVMQVFDLGYRDELGLPYAAWRKIFADQFAKYDDIKIRVLHLKVHVEDDGQNAEATLAARGQATVAATKGIAGQLPDQPVGAVDQAVLKFRKGATGWKLVSAKNLKQDQW